uniref:FGGY-family carbohydrate kinase n=1 Tax=Treponema endosymbiont of Eucomonympha sp. TaxID=1580831 RepID=UPI000AF56D92
SKSPVWRRMTADIMNLPVKRPANAESAAMGGAIQALWCLSKRQGKAADIAALTDEHIEIDESGSIRPDAGAVAAYDKAYAEYNRYLKALAPLYQ